MRQVFILPQIMPRDGRICQIVDALEDLPLDQGYKVEIFEHRSNRSNLQNSTLWWVYDTILKVGGNTTAGYVSEELHEFFLGRHFGVTQKLVFGDRIETPNRRSSKLSKIEFAAYMDSIYSFMASQGVVLPLPDPKHGWREVA